MGDGYQMLSLDLLGWNTQVEIYMRLKVIINQCISSSPISLVWISNALIQSYFLRKG